MDLNNAIMKALDGNAVLFVGAGFSQGATNLRGRPFRLASSLAEHLAEGANVGPGSALEDAAEAFAEQRGDDALITEIKEEFTAAEVSAAHRAIVRIPWKRIYTTNYDNVVETACRVERGGAPKLL